MMFASVSRLYYIFDKIRCFTELRLDNYSTRRYILIIRFSAKRIEKYAGILKSLSKAILGFSECKRNSSADPAILYKMSGNALVGRR
jgi:hypothetical protein